MENNKIMNSIENNFQQLLDYLKKLTDWNKISEVTKQITEINLKETVGKLRRNTSFTAKAEQKLLSNILPKIPSYINSDHLTFMGLIGAIMVSLGYYLSNFHRGFLLLSAFFHIIQWLGDSLDGQLARFRKNERPFYGFFIDHNLDAISIFLMAFGVGTSPYVTFSAALMFTIAYFFFFQLYYSICYLENVSAISYFNFGPTEIKILVIILTLVMYFNKNYLLQTKWGLFSIYDIIVAILIIIMMAIYFVSGVKKTKQFLEYDRKNNASKKQNS